MSTVAVPSGNQNTSSIADGRRPIDVLYLVGSLPLGGAENQVVTLASALSGDRYRIHVCCLRCEGVQASVLHARGIPIVSLNLRLRYWPLGVYRLYRLIRQLKPGILHTHLYEADIWGRLIGKLAGVPIILSTVHGRFYWRKHGLVLFLYRLLNSFSDRVVAVSEDICQGLIDRRALARDKVIAIPNAVDTERFGRLDCRDEVRTQLGIEANSLLIGTVGRLASEKRVDHYIQAARMVHEVAPQARFLIVGDGPLRAELESQAAALGLAPGFLRFLGSRLDIPELLSALDVFVLSSETEGIPVSLLEAMATARPVIATRVGGIPQVIEDGQNGLLVPPHDPKRLAEAILTILENRGLRESLAGDGRKSVEERFSTRVVAQQIVALYDDLLEKKDDSRAR